MTATLDLLRVSLTTSVSEAFWFEPLEDSTARVAEEQRRDRLARLVELSSAGDGLDWDTLARINIEGWGADGNTD
jgi:hypothetical protein